jgi:2-polyprenyl-3-methyl-5-hydroxy-6-metoxy-1,4-benzoquinol methylase
MNVGLSSRGVDRYGFVHDPESRRIRGARILAVLEDFGAVDVTAARILDIGCSAGLMTEAIAKRGACVVGIDVDADALLHAAARGGSPRYVAASGERLPFPDECFDAVVCNHVYEHVSDARALMNEAHRVLRDGGACYFAGGHTLQLIEPHHRLPLLSWLPRPLAGMWLRSLGRAAHYEERFVAPWRLEALLAVFPDATFISPKMIRDPVRYQMGMLAGLPRPLRAMLRPNASWLARLAPTWIYMLRKRSNGNPAR